MSHRAQFPGLLLAACALLVGGTQAALAEDDAAAAAQAVIAKLSPPSPAITYDYKGDLLVGGTAGDVFLTSTVAQASESSNE